MPLFTVTTRTKNVFLSIIGGFIVFFISSVFSITFIFNQFYVRGAYYLDMGWYSYLVGHNFRFLNPLPMKSAIGRYMWATHMYGFADLFSLVSYITSLPGQIIFSVFVGIAFGFLSLFAYVTLLRKNVNIVNIIFAILFGISLLFTQIVSSIEAYPHFEIWNAVLTLWFFHFYIKKYYKTALILLFLACLTREEVGLEIFGIFFMLFFVKFIFYKNRDIEIDLGFIGLLFGTLAAFISIVIVIIQHHVFSGAYLFKEEYLGTPIYAHLNSGEILNRLRYIMENKIDIYAPFFLLLFVSYIFKNWFLMVGYFAAAPWFVVNLLAVRSTLAHFFAYYAYPFLTAVLWPLIGYHIVPESLNRRFIVVMQTVAIIPCFILAYKFSWVWENFFPHFTTNEIVSEYRIAHMLNSKTCNLGVFSVDGSVLSIMQNQGYLSIKSGIFIKKTNKKSSIDSIVVFKNDIYRVEDDDFEKEKGLDNVYHVSGTPILIVSNKPIYGHSKCQYFYKKTGG